MNNNTKKFSSLLRVHGAMVQHVAQRVRNNPRDRESEMMFGADGQSVAKLLKWRPVQIAALQC